MIGPRSLLKLLLVLALLAYFLHQVVSSYWTYARRDVGIAYDRHMNDTVLFPTVTLCPLFFRPQVRKGTNMTEIYLEEQQTFLVNLTHRFDKETVMSFVPGQEVDTFPPGSVRKILAHELRLDEAPSRTLQPCFLYQPPLSGPATTTHRLELLMNLTHLTSVLMSLHDPNAPSFPTAQKVFGREDMIVVNRNDKDPDVSFNLWRISRHLWIRLHSIRSFLDCMPGDISKEKRAACYLKFFTRHFRCLLPWFRQWQVVEDDNDGRLEEEESELELCQTEEEFHKYMEMSQALYEADEMRMQNLTGCPNPCKYFEYTSQRLAEHSFSPAVVNLDGDTAAATKLVMQKVFFQESNYGVSREVLRYTSSDLLGNVGGWLGLLLGTSVLSLFDPVADSITRMAARA